MKPISITKLVMGALIAWLGLSAGAAAETIKVGTQPWLGYGPLWIAEEKGYFEDRGVDVELINFTWDQDVNAALASGNIQVECAASAYRRLPDSYAGPAARLFRGIDDRLIGTTGLALGGAAGDEIDRFVNRPDSLDRVYHLAVSQPMSPRYRLVVEDQLVSAPDTRGGRHPDVRADMIYGENDAGGRVFSAGSICFTAALPVDDYDNPVARLATNVINDFLD